MARKIVLASTSPYRRELMQRLGIPFECAIPNADESLIARETPRDRAKRLSIAKAKSLVASYSDAIIIGSDQVAECNGQILRKPGTIEKAVEQLKAIRDGEHLLHTGLHVIDTKSRQSETRLVTAQLKLRNDLSDSEIIHYIEKEKPVNCAGSYKIESTGIALFDHIDCPDWNAIIGLPLLELSQILRKMNVNLFAEEYES